MLFQFFFLWTFQEWSFAFSPCSFGLVYSDFDKYAIFTANFSRFLQMKRQYSTWLKTRDEQNTISELGLASGCAIHSAWFETHGELVK